MVVRHLDDLVDEVVVDRGVHVRPDVDVFVHVQDVDELALVVDALEDEVEVVDFLVVGELLEHEREDVEAQELDDLARAAVLEDALQTADDGLLDLVRDARFDGAEEHAEEARFLARLDLGAADVVEDGETQADVRIGRVAEGVRDALAQELVAAAGLVFVVDGAGGVLGVQRAEDALERHLDFAAAVEEGAEHALEVDAGGEHHLALLVLDHERLDALLDVVEEGRLAHLADHLVQHHAHLLLPALDLQLLARLDARLHVDQRLLVDVDERGVH